MKPSVTKGKIPMPATTNVGGVEIPATEDISIGLLPDSVTPEGQRESGVPATSVSGGVEIPARKKVGGTDVPAAKYGGEESYIGDVGVVVPETENVGGVEIPATHLVDGVDIPATVELYGADWAKYLPYGLVAIFGYIIYCVYKKR